MKTNVMSAACLLVLTGACADNIPVQPMPAGMTSVSTLASATGGAGAADTETETELVSPVLGEMNVQLAAAGSNLRITKAELLLHGSGWDASHGTIIFASDRDKGIGAEWVPGDPRRGGRTGVTYARGSNTSGPAFIFNDARTGFRPLTAAEVDAHIDEGMSAWRARACSKTPITRVSVPAGTDPDLLDQIFRGQGPSANYFQPADIVQSGWQPVQFFQAFAGAGGANILGVAFSFAFVDGAGNPTDIDGNGLADLGLSELYYNDRFVWGRDGSPNVVDLYSIITHESGHALGLGHFGKVFVTAEDAADGISVDEIKYAPRAMMNAVYVQGRVDLTGNDNGAFCRIWGGGGR